MQSLLIFLIISLSALHLAALTPNTCANPRTVTPIKTVPSKPASVPYSNGEWGLFYPDSDGLVSFVQYDTSGQPLNTPIIVSSSSDLGYPSTYIKGIDACVRSDGTAAVVWRTSANGVGLSIYDRSRNVIQQAINVSNDGSTARYVSIACLQDNSFAVVWGDDSSYKYRLYSSTGTPNTIVINGPSTYTGTIGYVTSTAFLGNYFAVCYSADSTKSVLALTVIQTNGNVLFVDSIIDNSGAGIDGCAMSKIDDPYNFVVGWTYSGNSQVYVRLVNGTGEVNSSSISVYTGNPLGSVGIARVTGGLAISWVDYDSGLYVAKLDTTLAELVAPTNLPAGAFILSYSNSIITKSNGNLLVSYCSSDIPGQVKWYEMTSAFAGVNNQSSYCTQSAYPYCDFLPTCYDCKNTAECASASKFCLNGYCTQKPCLINSDCTNSSLPYCMQVANYECVECLTNSNCPSDKSICSNYKCVCQSNSDCSSDKVCNLFSQVCEAPCNFSSDCSASYPSCLPRSKYCAAPCVVDSNCTEFSGGFCFNTTGLCRSRFGPSIRNITQDTNPNIIYIVFNTTKLSLGDLPSNLMTITFEGVSSDDFSYRLYQYSDNTIQATIYPDIRLPKPTMQITFTNIYNFSDLYYATYAGDLVINASLASIPFLPTDIDRVNNLKTYNYVVTGLSFFGSILMFILTENYVIMVNLFTLFQNFYYVLFFNIQYPANDNIFLNTYSWASFSFIPNPFKDYNPVNVTEVYTGPERFNDLGISSHFIQNMGGLLTFYFFFAIVVVSFEVIKFVLNRAGKAWLIVEYVHVRLIWNFIYRLYCVSYLPLQMYAVLQLSDIQSNKPQDKMDAALAIITFILNISAPIASAVWIFKKDFTDPQVLMGLHEIYDDYKEDKKIQINTMALFMARSTIFSILVVFAGSNYIVQGVLILIIDIWALFHVIFFKPFRERIDHIFEIVSYSFITFIHILASILYFSYFQGGNSSKKGYLFGWGIIIVCTFVSSLAFLLVAKEYIRLTIKLIKNRGKVSLEVKRVHVGQPGTKTNIADLETEQAKTDGEKESFLIEDAKSPKALSKKNFELEPQSSEKENLNMRDTDPGFSKLERVDSPDINAVLEAEKVPIKPKSQFEIGKSRVIVDGNERGPGKRTTFVADENKERGTGKRTTFVDNDNEKGGKKPTVILDGRSKILDEFMNVADN